MRGRRWQNEISSPRPSGCLRFVRSMGQWQSRWKPGTAQRSPTPTSTKWRRWVVRSTSACCRRPRRTGCCAPPSRIDDKLHGFMFSTLERIGGTPCVLLGLISVRRSSKRDQVLKGLMHEAYHRALMAFPDEDVVVGSRFVLADALEAFKQLDEIIPRPRHRAVGEERAWGRRLAKRFGVDGSYDEQTFVVKTNGQSGFIDHESLKPDKIARRRRGAVRRRQRGQGRLAHRPRVDDGRRPRQAGQPAARVSEFGAVVRRRRMTRSFATRPGSDPQLLDQLVDLAAASPSAGKTQGWHLVVLEGERHRSLLAPRLPGRAARRLPLARPVRRAGHRPAVRRSAGVRRALQRARQGRDRPRRRRRRLADAVLDGRRVDGGDDAAAGGRGRRPGRAVVRRVQRRGRGPRRARRADRPAAAGRRSRSAGPQPATCRASAHHAPVAPPARSSTAAAGEPPAARSVRR